MRPAANRAKQPASIRRNSHPARFLMIALLGISGIASAGETEEPDKALERIQEKLKSAQASREALESRRAALDEELGEIDRKNGRLITAINQLESDAKAQAQRLAELERQRGTLLAGLQTQQRALAGQARSAYATGQREWLKLLLNQEAPSRLTRVLAYHNYLSKARAALLQNLEQDLASAQRLQGELAAETDRLADTRQRLATERAALDESRRNRRKLLAELEHELRDQDAELRQLRDNEQRLQELLSSIQPSGEHGAQAESTPSPSSPPSTQEASLRCPVSGRLIEPFGSPRMSGKWDGILIAAEEGTPVRAVSKGRVAFSDWLRGYGLLVIIDHGDGVMSVYAFNQSLLKSVGESVAAGDIIATVGASGGRTEPGLYFGIRRQGKVEDPTAWCAASR